MGAEGCGWGGWVWGDVPPFEGRWGGMGGASRFSLGAMAGSFFGGFWPRRFIPDHVPPIWRCLFCARIRTHHLGRAFTAHRGASHFGAMWVLAVRWESYLSR